MKTLYPIFFLFILISGCKDNALSPEGIEGSTLTIQEIRDYLPAEYVDNAQVVFKNSVGSERFLMINYSETTVERNHDNETYNSERFQVTFFDPADLNFELSILATANYAGEENAVVKGLLASLMPGSTSGTVLLTVRFENDRPVISQFDDFRESLVLHEKTFADVFVGVTNTPAFSELNINSEVGIVAFRDRNNDLWVFDRFEQ